MPEVAGGDQRLEPEMFVGLRCWSWRIAWAACEVEGQLMVYLCLSVEGEVRSVNLDLARKRESEETPEMLRDKLQSERQTARAKIGRPTTTLPDELGPRYPGTVGKAQTKGHGFVTWQHLG